MPNAHISEYLDYYCNLEDPPEYALLLKGGWGIGKTYFVKTEIDRFNSKKIPCFYISLYGLSSTTQIDTALFKLIHPLLGSKGMELTGRALKSILSGALKINLNESEHPKEEGSVSIKLPDISASDIVGYSTKHVLFFDDMERCSIEICELLGYLNSFVEHQGAKLIMIANEDEILKGDKGDEKSNLVNSYRSIKEKLIGRTFEIAGDFENAIYDFIAKIKNIRLRAMMSDWRRDIYSIYMASNYNNLRHLKQSLMDFERFVDYLPTDALDKHKLVKILFFTHLSYSFEIQSGNILIGYIQGLSDERMRQLMSKADPSGGKNKAVDFYAKYSDFLTSFSPILTESIWCAWFRRGVIDRVDILESLQKTDLYNDDLLPNWVKLWRLNDLTDDEFICLKKSVWDEFNELKYDQLGIVKHVAGIMLHLSSSGLLDVGVDKVLEICEKNLINLHKNGMICESDYSRYSLFRDSWSGLMIYGVGSDEYKRFDMICDRILKDAAQESVMEAGRGLIELMKTDIGKFSRQLTLCNHEDQKYFEVPILQYVNIDEFIHTLFQIDPSSRYSVFHTIERRYDFPEITKKLTDEFEWTRKFIATIESYAGKNKDKLSGHQCSRVLEGGLRDVVAKLI